MLNNTKYKSVSIHNETYEKLVLLANAEHRKLSQQLRLLIDAHLEELTTPGSPDNLNR